MIKKLFLFMLLVCSAIGLYAQSCYWVFLTDKQGVAFDAHSYFDEQAIVRYRQCGADLYHITNYPLNACYVSRVNALATEEVGQSRWLNAVGVVATDEQAAAIAQLPCVKKVQRIDGEMRLARLPQEDSHQEALQAIDPSQKDNAEIISAQLKRMQGELFRSAGYDGKGVRIAVLDGGFPRVDSHEAFRHLREGNRIIDTWNFPKKKANVYGWSSHGLSTLSCIAGKDEDMLLGLATGAEFMLYRTEVDLEPAKEEVWWMMGMERADQHGANIISSSLGYGKERHYTRDMDGTSYVAKAANMAARKGILVCCSAGNEGNESQWKTIVTPSDADSALCIAGIKADLEKYEHIDFSSYGPSAKGTLKPNVAAFGHANAADDESDEAYEWVYGTSFSCPLVAGFAACAWQAMPGKTAMEMFSLIQQSADLYPYFDYAVGYGVPQASFFLAKEPTAKVPTFVFEDHDSCVYVRPTAATHQSTIFFNSQWKNGKLEKYYTFNLTDFDSSVAFVFDKRSICNRTLNVCLDGYSNSYRMSDDESYVILGMKKDLPFAYDVVGDSTNLAWDGEVTMRRTPEDNEIGKWGSCNRWNSELFANFGNMMKTGLDNPMMKGWSPSVAIGLRLMRAWTKSYSWGMSVAYGSTIYGLDAQQRNGLDNLFGVDKNNEGPSHKNYTMNEWSVELFQHIRFVAGGMQGKGIYGDLGIYVSHANYIYNVQYDAYTNANRSALYVAAAETYVNPNYLDDYRWNFGVTARLGYNWFGLYARYRLTGLGVQYDMSQEQWECPTSFEMNLPRLELGIYFNL